MPAKTHQTEDPQYTEPISRFAKSEPIALLKIKAGTFETAKKSNHSTLMIPSEVVDELEAGTVTCERIMQLSASFPIYRYQTCLTVHGRWENVTRERIGRYQNIRQNANGSLEILWTAVDLAKKQSIGKKLENVESAMRFEVNSSETYYVMSCTIDGAEKWNEVYATMKRIAERVKESTAYAMANIWKYSYCGMMILELRISLLAIPENEVDSFANALLDMTDEQYNEAAAKVKAKRDTENEVRNAAQAEREIERKANAKLEHAAATLVMEQLKSEGYRKVTDSTPMTTGYTYVGVGIIHQSATRSYAKFEKGSFGRVIVTRWSDHKPNEVRKQMKLEDALKLHRFPGHWMQK